MVRLEPLLLLSGEYKGVASSITTDLVGDRGDIVDWDAVLRPDVRITDLLMDCMKSLHYINESCHMTIEMCDDIERCLCPILS